MRLMFAGLAVCLCMSLFGCSRGANELVVYSARNEEHIKPIFDKYPKSVQEVAAKLYADLEEATKEQRKN